MILTNQVALVTGAGQGIGKASALALAEAGAHVVVADIDRQKAEVTADAIMSSHRSAHAVQADVGDLVHIDRMVREALEAFGQIDILLNNAGVTRRADIMDIREGDWDRIHRVNAKGVFFCLQRVAREMIPRRSGRIINIASIAGERLRRCLQRSVCREQGRGDQPDQDSVAAIGKTQYKRQRGLSRRHAHRLVGRQPACSRTTGRCRRGGNGTTACSGHSVEPGKRSGRHRRHGGLPGVARCAQYHWPIVQRRWRSDPGLDQSAT